MGFKKFALISATFLSSVALVACDSGAAPKDGDSVSVGIIQATRLELATSTLARSRSTR